MELYGERLMTHFYININAQIEENERLARASIFSLFKKKAQGMTAPAQAVFKGGPIDQYLAERSNRYSGKGHSIENSSVDNRQ